MNDIVARQDNRTSALAKARPTKTIEEIATQTLESESLAPYEGERFELHGKNNLEAAIATLLAEAASGVPEARKEVLDRVLGKPVQRQNIMQTNVTLVGFLDTLANDPDFYERDDIVEAQCAEIDEQNPNERTSPLVNKRPKFQRDASESVSEAEDGLSVLR